MGFWNDLRRNWDWVLRGALPPTKSDVVVKVTASEPWPAEPAKPEARRDEGYIVRQDLILAVSSQTPLICSDCKTEDCKTFYLKRRRGLYALLCFRHGQGCWERSARTNCSHVDGLGLECTTLAEYEIVSLDGRSSRRTCIGHIPFLIAYAVEGEHIFPLED